MNTIFRFLVPVILLSLSGSSFVFGVDKGKAKYVGGTVASLAANTEGTVNLTGEDKLMFLQDKGGYLEIPWTTMEKIEYGQDASVQSKTGFIKTPKALLSRGRRHYVTISFKDGDRKAQAAVFEFDKNEIRQNLETLEARSGKEIIFQDEEAKKMMSEEPAKKNKK